MGSVNQSITVADARFVIVLVRLYRLDAHPRRGLLFEKGDHGLVGAVLLRGLKTLVALLPPLSEFCIEKGVLSRQGSGFLE